MHHNEATMKRDVVVVVVEIEYGEYKYLIRKY